MGKWGNVEVIMLGCVWPANGAARAAMCAPDAGGVQGGHGEVGRRQGEVPAGL